MFSFLFDLKISCLSQDNNCGRLHVYTIYLWYKYLVCMIRQPDVMAQIISSYNGYFNLKSSCLKAIKLHPAKKNKGFKRRGRNKRRERKSIKTKYFSFEGET